MKMSICQACHSSRYQQKNTDEKHMFHRFPADPELCRKWLAFCGKAFLEGSSARQLHDKRLCSKHFAEDAYMGPRSNRLLPCAVPTLAPPSLLTTHKADNEDGARLSDAQLLLMLESGGDADVKPVVSEEDPRLLLLLESSLPQDARPGEVSGDPSEVILVVGSEAADEGDGADPHDAAPSRDVSLHHKVALQKLAIKHLRKKCRSLQRTVKVLRKQCSSSTLGASARLHVSPTSSDADAAAAAAAVRSARSWSADDKAIALGLLQQRPKCYQLLQKVVALPPRDRLHHLLDAIPLAEGLNPAIMAELATKARTLSPRARLCSLSFGEMPLAAGYKYDPVADRVDGLEELEGGREANAVLVFMARGLLASWKQPVAYYFCHDSTPADKLASLVTGVVADLWAADLRVVATVCDQSPNNMEAVEALCAHGRDEPCFRVRGRRVAAFYDPCHLLKNVRDCLHRFDCVLGDGGVARWQHLRMLHAADLRRRYRACPRLSAHHLDPEARLASRVSLAAQVLSRSVAAAIESLQGSGVDCLPPDSMHLAEVCMTMNVLFDSFNGRTGPGLARLLASGSGHARLWSSVVERVAAWQFVSAKGVLMKSVAQKGWLNNVAAAQCLQRRLARSGVHAVPLGSLNLDAMENLFTVVSHHGDDCGEPTTWQFVASLKAAIVNNLVRFDDGVDAGNCLDDGCDVLSDLRVFLAGEGPAAPQSDLLRLLEDVSVPDEDAAVLEAALAAPEDAQAAADAAMATARALAAHLAGAGACTACLSTLLTDASLLDHDYLRGVPLPSDRLVAALRRWLVLLPPLVRACGHRPRVGAALVDAMEANDRRTDAGDGLGCPQHGRQLRHSLRTVTGHVWLDTWCRLLSRQAGRLS